MLARIKRINFPSDHFALLALLVAILWFTHEMLWQAKVPFFRDLGPYFYPIRFSLAQSFKIGELPLWDRHMGMGFPLLADFQSATFYPPHLLFLFLPFFDAVRALFFFHYLVAAAGCYMLFRSWAYPPYLSLVGAAIFTFGGVIVSLTNLLNHFQTAVWLPWLILVGERVFRSGSWRHFISFTFIGLVQFLAGSPEFYAISMGLLFLDATRTKVESGSSLGRSTLLIVFANILIAGLSMVQVLPTLELLFQSRRPGRISYEEATAWSLHPVSLVNVFFLDKEVDKSLFSGLRLFFIRDLPFFVSYYMGQIALFGVCAWLCYSGRKEKIIFLGLIFIALAIGLGKYTPLYFYLLEHLPLLGLTRYPEKFLFPVYAFLVFITLKGLHEFLQEKNTRRKGPVLILSSILFLLSLIYFFFHFKPESMSVLLQRSSLVQDPVPWMLQSLPALLFSFERQLLLLVAVLLLLLIYNISKISPYLFRVLIVGLVFMDLTSAHQPYQFLVDPDFVDKKPKILSSPDAKSYRLFSNLPHLHPSVYTLKVRPFSEVVGSVWSTLVPNTGIFHAIDYMQEIDALGRKPYDLFLQVAKDLPPEKFYPFLGAFNVKYINSFTPLPDGEITLVRHFPEYPLWLYEIREPLPRTYIASRIKHEKDPVNTLNQLASREFNPFEEAVLDRPLSLPSNKNFQADARIVRYENQTVIVQASLNSPGVLVLADSYYPGWKAYVDGREEEILRANLFFRAVPLPEGEHMVEFRYEPLSFKIGLIISFITLSGLVVVSLGLYARKKRQSRPMESG